MSNELISKAEKLLAKNKFSQALEVYYILLKGANIHESESGNEALFTRVKRLYAVFFGGSKNGG